MSKTALDLSDNVPECDCPVDSSGLLSEGPKNHRPDCPAVAWIREIVGEVVEGSETPGIGTSGGFIHTPDARDIAQLNQRIDELQQMVIELEDRVMRLENE